MSVDPSGLAKRRPGSKHFINCAHEQWCRMVAPVLEEIATEHAEKIDVVKLNIDDNPKTAQRYQIMAIPTMNVFSGGQVVKQIVGAKPKSALLRELADFI